MTFSSTPKKISKIFDKIEKVEIAKIFKNFKIIEKI